MKALILSLLALTLTSTAQAGFGCGETALREANESLARMQKYAEVGMAGPSDLVRAQLQVLELSNCQSNGPAFATYVVNKAPLLIELKRQTQIAVQTGVCEDSQLSNILDQITALSKTCYTELTKVRRKVEIGFATPQDAANLERVCMTLKDQAILKN